MTFSRSPASRSPKTHGFTPGGKIPRATESASKTLKRGHSYNSWSARMTIPELQDHLYSLEERLLHPDREKDRTALIPLLCLEFKEFCVSGRIFNHQQVVDSLLKSEPRAATINNYYVETLAENAALATYSVKTALRVSHRSSVWVLRDNRWQLLFHQGTLAL